MTPAELAELDLAVAKAEGIFLFLTVDGKYGRKHGDSALYQPTRDSAEAMRLLEKYQLCLSPGRGKTWICQLLGGGDVLESGVRGKTPCIAICKAVVALKS